MSRTPKIDRARRNALKAASLVLGALLATGAAHRQAVAGGNNQGGNNQGGNGRSCFARGTQIRTREGYRPVEALAVGDEVAVRLL